MIRSHYYGDTVRQLLIVAGLLMLASGPFFRSALPVPALVSVLAVLVVVLAAGLINPQQRWTITLTTIISLFGFLVFEYYAMMSYDSGPQTFFWINQTLAILFFLALYLSTKTLRSKCLPERRVQLERRVNRPPAPDPVKLSDLEKEKPDNWFA